MRFLLDGTTGLLGRNLLFEILKYNLNCLDEIEIIILGKESGGVCLECRMDDIILNDGFDYLNIEKNLDYFSHIKSRIKFIEFDLTKPCLGLNPDDIQILRKEKIDFFFHIAALLNFNDTHELTKKLYLINFKSNITLINLSIELGIKEFIYVSTAYSAGSTQIEINPDFINRTGFFRNPYEKFKLETELYLLDIAKRENINYKIFRPTTISGRLIEKEIGSINKFDVFYEWARWIMKYKMKILKNSNDAYNQPLGLTFRITMHAESGMNIIPADYAAKLLYYSSLDNLNEKNFHLVNDYDIPTNLAAKLILDTLNIQGYCFVEKEPEEKNKFEQFYYRTVGKIFTPYVIDPPLHYNNDNLKEIKKNYNLTCPEMNEGNFQKLLDYAKKHNFGIAE
ncbi:MAG: hypothetical protein A2X61_07275 [Ignavibacteria bacterium GWB2_35_12]|nr:MAG: hypothetical protein A2X63_08510 [Ignavibacteria bacterium GWA2_35_8]OGU39279.1 MAG: hypothetical protein A2X61_07275 [Ignavibacteria bacterium GWB2_35_12]OGU89475.1 MAG: hypothetical protein A2220_11020 [Ignavibacteria bacterium RIFOXYA2_FULL_35_10]OGV21161.1 MAG: hypothetical protein A2475_01375 [Ignavibacteria bacterium RIFOXYC2_FULL_35_21]